ncbi:MAG: hypothetical protein FJX47_18540 [Alphaproteobacteria bacterium]|nr:hypothetical protein [Alphaproteobacteria bacterium]
MAVLGAVALAACQPVPQPFQPDEKPKEVGGLLDLGPRAGLVVAPIAGLGEAAAPMAEALALKLQAKDVAATARRAARGAYLLQGEARIGAEQAGLRRLTLAWRIVDARGLARGEVIQEEMVPAATWPPRGAQIEALAGGAVTVLARLVGIGEETPAIGGSRVHLRGVGGAPGDGNRRLALSLRAALRHVGLTMAEAAPGADFLIDGLVKMSPAPGGEKVEIVWTLFDNKGREIGTTSQANVVALGSLDGPWGPVADVVAEAAAPGILEVLLRTEQARR